MKVSILRNQKIKTAGGYLFAILLSVILLSLIMHLRHARLDVPFENTGDALLHSMFIKGMIDNGWYMQNPYLGAPGELQLHDFPVAENLHMLVMKALTVFTSDHATILNLYFLLSFPLTTVTSLYVFRQFELSYAPALAGSLLYTFLPYHFLRNEHHLFLAAYFLVPLAILVVLWVCGGFTLFTRVAGKRGWRLQFGKQFVLSLLVCAAIGSSGVYYPFFTCVLLLVAGIMASILRRSAVPAFSAIILTAVVALFVFANLLPSVIYKRRHGDTSTATRHAGESEIFGLKISQLVLPITFHRVPSLAHLKDEYNRKAPLVGENDTASLGFFGTIGFLFLISWGFLRLLIASEGEGRMGLLDQLSTLNLAALLFGTIGGFGTVFALVVSPRIRSINRVSVYIAFFSIFAVFLVLDAFFRRRMKSKRSRLLFFVGIAACVSLAVLDQTGNAPDYRPAFQSARIKYESDTQFVRAIQGQLRPGAMIFQLPFAHFPEQGHIHKMGDHSHFRGYLHSRSLRWSYGAMRNRPVDAWQSKVAALPSEEFLKEIVSAGFDGIFVNRTGYNDNAARLETELSLLIDSPPLVSRARDLSFFNLTDYKERLKGPSN